MGLHRIKRGLRLPILGEPSQEIETAKSPRRVALLGADYVGMRPTLHVKVGETVRRGQLLFEDKKMPGVRYTSPAAGKIAAVNRGDKRVFQSVVIELSRAEIEGKTGSAEEVSYSAHTGKPLSALTESDVRNLLLESGLWTAMRARPHSRVANPADTPHSIFVTAADSNPLAPEVAKVMEGKEGLFKNGLAVLGKLTEGPVFVCTDTATPLQLPDDKQFRHEQFKGPHPAGTVGLHIHTLDPVDRNKVVWHLGYQDVIAIGHLFETGRLLVERVIALAGPAVARPRLLATRIGASTDDLVADETNAGENRVISGSVLAGRKAMGADLGYLGRYANQVTVIREDTTREFLGWLAPGANKFSVVRTHLGSLIPGKKFPLTTTTNGSVRNIVPIGMFEKVMPLDLMPTQLLKSLLMRDLETAERLGCLELDEEDLALCTFVCPGKNDYGPCLRDVLTTIEKEG
jgi:Na+-transporting NADH:ubiquinone oxidoreductase subunit A